ncbi:hypothetical protein J4E83_004272 [Alternaria metachromatica]|uniref:uncharacterized protein n=1 Tax=Alternaria metachromatica TaxID=283354 RepID=UPI0020C26480|nr:uncharacterized protein J4E83_004272 [Alternaria metachromatica]KAI4624596.1 hypothetical protein J4E83_004272 [Alternaria metachromatica]
MAGDAMLALPMSPTQSPKEFGSAAVQWACTRRGRMMVLTIALLTLLLGLTGMRNHEAISSRYHNFSSYYPWRPYLQPLPDIVHSPFKTPSNTTLQIENGELDHVPPKLKKTTPNFHLLMPAERDTDGFCKTTLSAMLLHYPPPTAVQLHKQYEPDVKWDRDTLNSTLHYLSNEKLVKDHDLVLIVDGQQSMFQLPSDVIVTQYKRLLADANMRLLKKYGVNKEGYQKFNQTTVFGAEKICENDDMACKYVPQSILSDNTYGSENGRRISDTPAKFIHSKMVMGPASDLKMLYQFALEKFMEGRSQSQTVQSVFATLFAEQQLGRDAEEVASKHTGTKVKEYLTGRASTSEAKRRLERASAEFSNTTRHEFSVGLDYTHALFQPLDYCVEDELVPILHDNSTDLSQYSHFDPDPRYLTLPIALNETKTPFWRPDFVEHNPSPNEKPAYIDNLEFTLELDGLPSRKLPWESIPLVQNTYSGSVPAIILGSSSHSSGERSPAANITWDNLWYSDHKRAMLRNYFRAPQSSDGYHNHLVGGDRYWDNRGGRGGIWTEAEQTWLPWGEVDGVCGTLPQLKEVFNDGKGVWLHELEQDNEQGRLNEEEDHRQKQEEARLKDIEELVKLEQEAKEKNEQKEKESIDFEKLKELQDLEATDEKKVERRRKRWNVVEECYVNEFVQSNTEADMGPRLEALMRTCLKKHSKKLPDVDLEFCVLWLDVLIKAENGDCPPAMLRFCEDVTEVHDSKIFLLMDGKRREGVQGKAYLEDTAS